MVVEIQKRFLSKEDLGDSSQAVFEIKNVTVGKDAKQRQDVTLKLHQKHLDIERDFSLWGDNLNKCIKKWGTDEQQWIGKNIKVTISYKGEDNRAYRSVDPL